MAKGTQSAPRPARREMTSEEMLQIYNEELEKREVKRAARRGRPRLPPDEGKRHALGIRTTKQLRQMLEEAAKASGRSLAQEVEHRLERSFEQSQVADAVLNAESTLKEHILKVHNELRSKLEKDLIHLRHELEEIKQKEITKLEEQRAFQEWARTSQNVLVARAPRDPRVVAGPVPLSAPREPRLKPLLVGKKR